jgi:hypothetical protein
MMAATSSSSCSDQFACASVQACIAVCVFLALPRLCQPDLI